MITDNEKNIADLFLASSWFGEDGSYTTDEKQYLEYLFSHGMKKDRLNITAAIRFRDGFIEGENK